MTDKQKITELNKKIVFIKNWEEHPFGDISMQKQTLEDNIEGILSKQSLQRFNLINVNDFIQEAPYLGDLAEYVNDTFFKRVESILEDEKFFLLSPSKTKEDLLKLKLLKARRSDFDFEEKLAKILCGDNTKFPYRSSYYITKFFEEAGFNYQHDGTTRYVWITNVLKELNIEEIYILIQNLFKRKYFVDFCNTQGLDLEQFIKEAKDEFNLFITESLKANDIIDFSSAFDLNINTELLFDKTTSTKDTKLNEFLEKAKDFYMEGETQEAMEKLWDAFERIKTYLPGKDKKAKSQALVSLLSSELSSDIFDQEFISLTSIGNNYMIRHTETDKVAINEELDKDYLFFRMLALLNLSIEKIRISESGKE